MLEKLNQLYADYAQQLNELPHPHPSPHSLKTTGYDALTVVFDATLVFLFFLKGWQRVVRALKKNFLPGILMLALLFSFYQFQDTPVAMANIQSSPSSTQKLPTIKETIKVEATPHFQKPLQGTISQPFWKGHPGVDIPNPIGTPIRPVASGTVEFAGWDASGYGNTILIRHADDFESRYAHLSALWVKTGARVSQTTVIGLVGNTGRATGSHLHLELHWNGITVDPEKYLPVQ